MSKVVTTNLKSAPAPAASKGGSKTMPVSPKRPQVAQEKQAAVLQSFWQERVGKERIMQLQ